MENSATSSGQMALLEPVEHPHKPFTPGTQPDRVHSAMMDGEWRTLAQIAQRAVVPETTVGTRIRDLRKPKGYEHVIRVARYRLGSALRVYKMEEKPDG